MFDDNDIVAGPSSSSSHSSDAAETPSSPIAGRRRKPKTKETDYSSATYWADRFSRERAFEWLASSAVICPIVLHTIRGAPALAVGVNGADGGGVDSGTPAQQRSLRLLHFGSGTSSLGAEVQRYLTQEGVRVEVTDADYVAESIQPMQEKQATSGTASNGRCQGEEQDPIEGVESNGGVPLVNLNVLSPEQLQEHMPRRRRQQGSALGLDSVAVERRGDGDEDTDGDEDGWDILLDKSTADAISCGPDIPLPSFDHHDPPSPSAGHNAANEQSGVEAEAPLVEPIVALCHTLAHATRKGARWVCISYSSTRFDHLVPPAASAAPSSLTSANGEGTKEVPGWRLLSKTPVDGFTDSSPSPSPLLSGQAGGNGGTVTGHVVYAPQVNVWAYVLERI